MNQRNGNNMVAEINKETKITSLSLLSNFYDDDVFNVLVKSIYDKDASISIEAIRASAKPGNDVVIPHLYNIIEKGSHEQRIEAIRAFSKIKSPSTIERLTKYFLAIENREVKKEILSSINAIQPTHPEVKKILRGAISEKFYSESIIALFENAEYSLVKEHFFDASWSSQRDLFEKIAKSKRSEELDLFYSFRDVLSRFDSSTKGIYLAIYELLTNGTETAFVLKRLLESDSKTVSAFIFCISNYYDRFDFSILKLFRLLTKTKYIDSEIESIVGDLLVKIAQTVKNSFEENYIEIVSKIETSIEWNFNNIKSKFISFKNVKEVDVVLAIVLAKLLEQYGDLSLIKEVADFFNEEIKSRSPSLVKRVSEIVAGASVEEKNRMSACLKLFNMQRSSNVKKIHNVLSRADTTTPTMLRDLNRYVRLVGHLGLKTLAKKIGEIYYFARSEKITFLEETCSVVICQLMNKNLLEEIESLFLKPKENVYSINGYIRGYRYINPQRAFTPIIASISSNVFSSYSKSLAAETISCLDKKFVKSIISQLIPVLSEAEDDKSKTIIADTISEVADGNCLQPLYNLLNNPKPLVRKLSVETIRKICDREKISPSEIIVNKLYSLLEDDNESVRVSSLMALLSFNDDYAERVFSDFIKNNSNGLVCKILDSLDQNISFTALNKVLDLLSTEDFLVHEKLRNILKSFCNSNLAQEIRSRIISILKGEKVIINKAKTNNSFFNSNKEEYKFRKEFARVLTVLFADIEDFTGKSEKLSPNALVELVKEFEKTTIENVEKFRGRLVKTMGDGILAIFGSPVLATVAAIEMQKRITENNQFKTEQETFRIRIGINSGEVIIKDSDVIGDNVNLASRMMSSANPGDIYLTESSYESVKKFVQCVKLGKINVKGKGEVLAFSAVKPLFDISKVMNK